MRLVKMKILLLLFFASFGLQAGEGKMVIADKLFEGKCNPCSLEYKNMDAFDFSYEKVSDKKLKLKLNEEVFNLDIELSGHKFSPVPFYQVKFKKKPDVKLFSFLAEGAINNRYYHYFIKQDKKFVYLGRFAKLSYDEEKEDFFSVVKDTNVGVLTRYKLNGTKLSKTEEKVEGGAR